MWLALAAVSLAAPLRFAAFGDAPYRDEDIPRVDALIAGFAGRGLAFAVHVGDVKSGRTPCDDATLRARRDQLARSPIPLVYTPGDNEWTDCHRTPIGDRPVDPLERLAMVRSLFYAAPLGAGALEVVAQVRHEQAAYPENQRWSAGGVVFATFHLTGSADGRGRDAAGDAEALARRRANLAWLAESVAVARASEARAIVWFEQADPDLTPKAFADWTAALATAATAADRPVLLVHGDSHAPRVDPAYLGVARLWRVVVPGDDRLAASVITVDPAGPTPFLVETLAASP
jgi:hypothetical protein